MRIAIGIEFDGSAFFGWQFQGHARAVQQVVEEALSKIADHPVRVHAAGRTDAGVHARGMVAHFDTTAQRSMRAWVMGTNSNLPKDAGLLWAQEVSEDFHARFRATSRRYRYVIYERATRSPLLERRATWVYRPLDVERMQQGAAYLIGTHDFSSYRAQACQSKKPVKTVTLLSVRRAGELIYIDIQADGFLHHMVRNIAGVLIAIGQGEREPVWAKEVLDARDRNVGGITAPPDGLYFMEAAYPEEFALPRVSSPILVW